MFFRIINLSNAWMFQVASIIICAMQWVIADDQV